MIIATAGHIDHGKTALVKALTGTDADRLPEEKARGLTIDLGFAYMRLDSGQDVGFVDVPGHERFIRNMLAGVTGIDAALLIVAADDGPMPQTQEHLAILDLLGVGRGIVAITKTDRVDGARVDAVRAGVSALLAGTGLEGAPVVPVSAHAGQGIDELRRLIEGIAREVAGKRVSGRFRLAVDRVFTLRGAGLVVTGTAFAGTVKVGDRLTVSPGGADARVRGVHAQGSQTHSAREGQRIALNLTGQELRRHGVSRGDWVLAPEAHAPTRRIDAGLRVLPGEMRPLRDHMPAHVHIGAVDVTGRIAVLEGRAVPPGETGWVQLLLDREIGALAGDGIVIRDQSATRTIAGGRVVDPFPPARGRARPERLGELAVLAGDAPFAGLLERAPFGFDFVRFARARNLNDGEQTTLKRRAGAVFVEGMAIGEGRWRTLLGDLEREVAAWIGGNPDSPGLGPVALRRRLDPVPPRGIAEAALNALVSSGRLARSGGHIHPPGHRAALPREDEALWARIEPLLAEGGPRPPRVRELGEQLGEDHRRIEVVLRQAGRLGWVRQVADNRYFPAAALRELAGVAEALAGEGADGRFTAAAYKDRSGIGRNVTIQLLEYFDRVGFTRREGDTRRIVREWRD